MVDGYDLRDDLREAVGERARAASSTKKPSGLFVDYLGLAHELKRALANYTDNGGTGRTAIEQAEAVALMCEKYEIG